MSLRRYQPATYVVRWGDVSKAGFTTGNRRWRSFELRGAEVVDVTIHDDYRVALSSERLLESWFAHLGHPAFESKADAAPWLGNQGGGWTECYCLCDVGPSQSGRFCDSQSGRAGGLPRRTPTYGTYGTNEETTQLGRESLGSNAHASARPNRTFQQEVADEKYAASLTGCVPVDWYCGSHTEDGNPSWVMCRWMPVAMALRRARDRGVIEGIRFDQLTTRDGVNL